MRAESSLGFTGHCPVAFSVQGQLAVAGEPPVANDKVFTPSGRESIDGKITHTLKGYNGALAKIMFADKINMHFQKVSYKIREYSVCGFK